MPSSFTTKTIQISLALGKGAFSEGGNTKIIEGLACEVNVTKPGLPEKNSANIKIWGLDYNSMAQLTMLSYRPLESLHNIISVKAGTLGGELSLVFCGEITRAFADFNQSPDPVMQFEASTGFYPQQLARPPQTVQGEAPAADLFAQWAKDAGYTYKNEGLTASTRNATFPGSPVSKMQKLARDIGCELIIDDGTVITMPSGQAREGNAVLLNKDTGLIGYPTFNQDGISCKCIYNPGIVYGGTVKIESIVPRASGTWRTTKVTHNLSAYAPGGGNWETQMEAAFPWRTIL